MTEVVLSRRQIARYGWRRDTPDFRDLFDHQLQLASPLKPVPDGMTQFSLRGEDPAPPYDQGQLGSCTGNGVAGVVAFRRKQLGLPVWIPSRLYIYFWERFIEGTVGQDSGAEIRDGIKVVAKRGAPPEDLWPYDIRRFTEQPPAEAEQRGATDRVLKYARVHQSSVAIKRWIYNGFPVVFGFTVYESFESDTVARTGQVPYPSTTEQVLGGHCVVLIGWNDTMPVTRPVPQQGMYEVRNSWGTGWGDGGYCWMPSQYILNPNLASDFWVTELVQGQ